MTYKLLKNPYDGREDHVILRKADNAYIPYDPDNSDYQEYLEWKAAGNTPEAAD